MPKRSRRFVFNKRRRLQGFRRRFLKGLSGAVFDADHERTIEPLFNYLMSGSPLSMDDREELAYFIRRLAVHMPGKNGRPLGPTVGNPQMDAARQIALWVRQYIKEFCTKNKRQRAPKGMIDELIASFTKNY